MTREYKFVYREERLRFNKTFNMFDKYVIYLGFRDPLDLDNPDVVKIGVARIIPVVNYYYIKLSYLF